MGYRSSVADVRAIIDTALEDRDIMSFLSTANALVDEVVTNEGYSDVLLQKIETWLAAHFVAIRDPRIAREKVGEATVEYHGKTDMGLRHTPYGQQVLMLDHHGKFAEITDGKGYASVETIT